MFTNVSHYKSSENAVIIFPQKCYAVNLLSQILTVHAEIVCCIYSEPSHSEILKTLDHEQWKVTSMTDKQT